MGGGIRRRIQIPLYLFALQVHNNHIVGGQLIIFHAGGLDDKEAGFPIDTGNIAPGEYHQAVGGKHLIGFAYLFLQFFKHGSLSFSSSMRKQGKRGTMRFPCSISTGEKPLSERGFPYG